MDSNSVIAIDGYASTGKSTLAKMLSRHYQIPFIDSGAMYRGITLFALQKGLFNDDQLDQEALAASLKGLSLRFDPQTGDLYLNGENVSQKIRLPHVSDHVSTIAALTVVRKFLLYQLRLMANENALVMDGKSWPPPQRGRTIFQPLFTNRMPNSIASQWRKGMPKPRKLRAVRQGIDLRRKGEL